MSRIFAMLFLVMTLVPVTAAPAAAAACSCAMRTPRTSLGEVAAVFSGTVTDVDEPLFDAGEVTATLRPDHVYKGEPEAELRVTTHAQSTACGYRFEEGRRYLIFAGSGRSGLSTTLCSGNLRLPPGERALRLSDRTVGMQPLTPELLAVLGTPVPVRPEPAPSRTPAVVAAVTAALALAVGAVFWLRRRAR